MSNQRLFGSIIMISGSVIGAGMLALPLATGDSGFIPASLLLVLGLTYLLMSAFCLLEVVLQFPNGGNFATMGKATLGQGGEWATKILFGLILYALLASYIAGDGSIVAAQLTAATGYLIPTWVGSLGFAIVLGLIIRLGMRATDWVNRSLAVVLFMSLSVVMWRMSSAVQVSHLSSMNVSMNLWHAVPIVIIAFTYQPIIPAMRDYLENDLKRIRIAFIVGGLIPFTLFLAWQFLVSGVLDSHGVKAIADSATPVVLLSAAIKRYSGIAHIQTIINVFSFCAITTSFIGVAVSCMHYLKDSIGKQVKSETVFTLLMVTPPLIFAEVFPKAYMMALNYAGIFVIILFGLFPPLMAYRLRQRSVSSTVDQTFRFGKGYAGLITLFLLSSLLIVMQL